MIPLLAATSATIKVRIEVEVTVGNWNTTDSFASLNETAQREAMSKLRRLVGGNADIHVITEPVALSAVLNLDLRK